MGTIAPRHSARSSRPSGRAGTSLASGSTIGGTGGAGLMEPLVGWLKEARRAATRLEELARHELATVHLRVLERTLGYLLFKHGLGKLSLEVAFGEPPIACSIDIASSALQLGSELLTLRNRVRQMHNMPTANVREGPQASQLDKDSARRVTGECHACFE